MTPFLKVTWPGGEMFVPRAAALFAIDGLQSIHPPVSTVCVLTNGFVCVLFGVKIEEVAEHLAGLDCLPVDGGSLVTGESLRSPASMQIAVQAAATHFFQRATDSDGGH